jgi:hypothetical protein
MAYPKYLSDLHLVIWLKQKRRRNKRSGSCTFAGRYADTSKWWLHIVQYPHVFGCSFACRKISAAKFVLAHACCPLSVPSGLPSTHQYLQPEHSASTTHKTRTAWNRGILVLAIIRLGCEGFSSGVAKANEKVVNAPIIKNATHIKLKIFFQCNQECDPKNY